MKATSHRWPFPEDCLVDDDQCEGDRVVYYFAFGSNLSVSKMEARGIAIDTEPVNGILRGWRLSMNLIGFPPVEPSFANIVKVDSKRRKKKQGEQDKDSEAITTTLQAGTYRADKGKEQVQQEGEGEGKKADSSVKRTCDPQREVHGRIYKLSPLCFEFLWRGEGATSGWYKHALVDVEEYKSGTVRPCVTFVSTKERTAPKHEIACSHRYKALLVNGAKEAGLDKDYTQHLDRLLSVPSGSLSKFAFSQSIYFHQRVTQASVRYPRVIAILLHAFDEVFFERLHHLGIVLAPAFMYTMSRASSEIFHHADADTRKSGDSSKDTHNSKQRLEDLSLFDRVLAHFVVALMLFSCIWSIFLDILEYIVPDPRETSGDVAPSSSDAKTKAQ